MPVSPRAGGSSSAPASRSGADGRRETTRSGTGVDPVPSRCHYGEIMFSLLAAIVEIALFAGSMCWD